MRTQSGNGTALAREAYPSHVLFEEQDGVWWLRGKDLLRVRKLLNLAQGDTAMGFDTATLSLYMNQLSEKGIKVGLLRGDTVRTIESHRPRNRREVPSTAIGLMPELLLGHRELERLACRVAAKRSYLADLVARIKVQLADSQGKALGDFGRPYVYQVADDIYEVDWDLTPMTRVTFEALAVIAHERGQMLSCQLVEPKGRRTGKQAKERKPQLLTVIEPVTYGQLKFSL